MNEQSPITDEQKALISSWGGELADVMLKSRLEKIGQELMNSDISPQVLVAELLKEAENAIRINFIEEMSLQATIRKIGALANDGLLQNAQLPVVLEYISEHIRTLATIPRSEEMIVRSVRDVAEVLFSTYIQDDQHRQLPFFMPDQHSVFLFDQGRTRQFIEEVLKDQKST